MTVGVVFLRRMIRLLSHMILEIRIVSATSLGPKAGNEALTCRDHFSLCLNRR